MVSSVYLPIYLPNIFHGYFASRAQLGSECGRVRNDSGSVYLSNVPPMEVLVKMAVCAGREGEG